MSQNECFLQVVSVKRCNHSDTKAAISESVVVSSPLWHCCPRTPNLEFRLGFCVINRQQETRRVQDKRHGDRINDSPAFSSCDSLACSIRFGRTVAKLWPLACLLESEAPTSFLGGWSTGAQPGLPHQYLCGTEDPVPASGFYVVSAIGSVS